MICMCVLSVVQFSVVRNLRVVSMMMASFIGMLIGRIVVVVAL